MRYHTFYISITDIITIGKGYAQSNIIGKRQHTFQTYFKKPAVAVF